MIIYIVYSKLIVRHGYCMGTGLHAGLRIPTRTRTLIVPVPVTRVGYPYPCRSLSVASTEIYLVRPKGVRMLQLLQ